jgi:redox-sensitive bicupin YhaK (pirin superfamily)
MPAVTADTLTLPKVAAPTEGTPRRVRSITTGPTGFEGEGFPVRRTFAGVPSAELDPFIMMDQMGEVDYAPYEPRGTDWHPHRGFETVTYIIDGTFVHQDSHGGGGVITNGATQWMTAGGGILHIETPPEELVVSGGLFHGHQLWVNLPAKDKMTAPRYQNLEADQVVLLSSEDGGALVRLIAGDLGAHTGPGSTYTPVTVAHVTVFPDSQVTLPWNPAYNALTYVLSGTGTAGVESAPVHGGNLVVFGGGDSVTYANTSGEPLELFVLGGQPIREPVQQYGPFVMNTRQQLQQAIDDFNAGKLGSVPANGLRPFRR